jgi:hypothetical protein
MGVCYTFCFVYDPAPGHSIMIPSFASALLFDTNAYATPEKVVPCMATLVSENLGWDARTYKIDTNDELRLASASSFNLYSIIPSCIRHRSSQRALRRICSYDRRSTTTLRRRSHWSYGTILRWIASHSSGMLSCGIDRWRPTHDLGRRCVCISWSWRHGRTCRSIAHSALRVTCRVARRPLARIGMIHYGVEATC